MNKTFNVILSVLVIICVLCTAAAIVFVVREFGEKNDDGGAKLVSVDLALTSPETGLEMAYVNIKNSSTEVINYAIVTCQNPPISFKNSDLVLSFKAITRRRGDLGVASFLTLELRGGMLNGNFEDCKEFRVGASDVQLFVGNYAAYPALINPDFAVREISENQLLLMFSSKCSSSYDSEEDYLLSDFSIVGIAG